MSTVSAYAATGYGAGVRSPGWYAHVFNHPGEAGVSRWFVGAARLLRDRGAGPAIGLILEARTSPGPGFGAGMSTTFRLSAAP